MCLTHREPPAGSVLAPTGTLSAIRSDIAALELDMLILADVGMDTIMCARRFSPPHTHVHPTL